MRANDGIIKADEGYCCNKLYRRHGARVKRGRRRGWSPLGDEIIHAILPLCNASRCLPRRFADWRILASPQHDHRNFIFGETSELSDYLCMLSKQNYSNIILSETEFIHSGTKTFVVSYLIFCQFYQYYKNYQIISVKTIVSTEAFQCELNNSLHAFSQTLSYITLE